jgi:hypothetical protein
MPLSEQQWVRHGPTCICFRCRGRRRRLARQALVESRVLVSSDRAAAHIEELLAAGLKRAEIARRAGVSAALVTKASRAGGSINAASEEKLLGVCLSVGL